MSDKPLMEQILEEEIRRLQLEIDQLQHDPPTNELEQSKYVTQVPVNSGPDYLKVEASLWRKPYISIKGSEIRSLDEARRIAKSAGYEGIYVEFGGNDA